MAMKGPKLVACPAGIAERIPGIVGFIGHVLFPLIVVFDALVNLGSFTPVILCVMMPFICVTFGASGLLFTRSGSECQCGGDQVEICPLTPVGYPLLLTVVGLVELETLR